MESMRTARLKRLMDQSIEAYQEKIRVLTDHLGERVEFRGSGDVLLQESGEFLLNWKGAGCPLCKALRGSCGLCPIGNYAANYECQRTPWPSINNWFIIATDGKAINATILRYHEKELAFLRKVRASMGK